MKPSDQLTVLEAIALGYALAGNVQAGKIFAILPSSEWAGPLAGLAQCLEGGRTMGLGIIGCPSPPLASQAMKVIVDELIVAETEKRRRSMSEDVAKLAARMSDPRLPGGVPTESEIEDILAKARGLYGSAKASEKKGGTQADSGGIAQASRELVKTPGKAV